jgi:hypothetical protein
MDGHDRHHGHARVGQDLSGLVRLPGRRPQGGSKGIAAMPQPPGRAEVEAAAILLGVDHEHPTGADHQVINSCNKAKVAAGLDEAATTRSWAR